MELNDIVSKCEPSSYIYNPLYMQKEYLITWLSPVELRWPHSASTGQIHLSDGYQEGKVFVVKRQREENGYSWLQNKHQTSTLILMLQEQIAKKARLGSVAQCVLGKQCRNWRMF
jgi:hypothetical protein